MEIPNALSLLAYGDPHARVHGLSEVPPDARPPVTPVHVSFQVMVGIGFALLFLVLWYVVILARMPLDPRAHEGKAPQESEVP